MWLKPRGKKKKRKKELKLQLHHLYERIIRNHLLQQFLYFNYYTSVTFELLLESLRPRPLTSLERNVHGKRRVGVCLGVCVSVGGCEGVMGSRLPHWRSKLLKEK